MSRSNMLIFIHCPGLIYFYFLCVLCISLISFEDDITGSSKPKMMSLWPWRYTVIPKVPWTSLNIWSSKGRTFTGPKKITQFKCNILFSCIFIYVSPVFNFIKLIFTKVIIIIIFAIFCMSWCRCSHRNPAIRDWSTTSR